jgi:hypothetical protein
MSPSKLPDGYDHFVETVTHERRYIRDRTAERFLKMVRLTAQKRCHLLFPETGLWRAQLGCDWNAHHADDGSVITRNRVAYGPDRMTPLPERATEGRANPKGIPCLYLATDCDTAIGEVRPWIASYVSVGLFKARRKLRLVNCMTDDRPSEEICKMSPAGQDEESAWSAIDLAFARPVDRADDTADYVPTQIIAELLKKHRFDGLIYRSQLGNGRNVALFDLQAARLVESHLFYVRHITLDSRKVSSNQSILETAGDHQ